MRRLLSCLQERDKGTQYFSLVYNTASSSHHFYPDYIVKLKNGDVYIVETKGGENTKGEDKNIDEYAPLKFEALKAYLEKYNLKGHLSVIFQALFAI